MNEELKKDILKNLEKTNNYELRQMLFIKAGAENIDKDSADMIELIKGEINRRQEAERS